MSDSIRDKINSISYLLKVEDQIELVVSIIAAAIIANGSLYFQDIQKPILVVLFGLCSLTGVIVFNQYHDIEVDRINKPYRPLPAGKIKKETALKIVFLSYLVSLIISLYLGLIYIILALINILLGVTYSQPSIGTRRNVILSTILVSIGYAILSFIMGWSIYKPLIAIPWWFVAFLFVTDVGEVLTKDYRDIKGDKKHNRITLPVKYGRETAVVVNTLIYMSPLILLLISSLAGFVNIKFGLLAVYCMLTGSYALSLLYKEPHHKYDVWCYKIFTSNYFAIRILCVWAFI